MQFSGLIIKYIINWNDIAGIVIPFDLIDTPPIKEIINNYKDIDIEYYMSGRTNLSEYQGEIERLSRNILERMKYI